MLNFLYYPVSWVMLQWHRLFSWMGLGDASGAGWALSIVFLVITMRLVLFRLFIKQVKYQRQMSVLQPQIKAIQKKYKDDRQAQQREMMKLQQEHGFNPLSGCLPLLLQWPIFIALFHVLRVMADMGKSGQFHEIYAIPTDMASQAAVAKVFGAPLAGSLTMPADHLSALHGSRGVMVGVILVLVLISATATFMTQFLARRANPVQPEGTAATVQRVMQYVIPLGTLGSGLFFPLGVLVYWFVSNVWTMLQQLYVNKYHPHEGPAKPAQTGAVGKTLAPKPGQRPVRGGKSGVGKAVTAGPAEVVEFDEGGGSSAPPQKAVPSNAAGSAAPRPGQRPNRPSGGPRKKRR